jgi:hypothetical protein
MRLSHYLLLGALAIGAVAGCKDHDDHRDGGKDDADPPDAPPGGNGTCGNEIDLMSAGTRTGDTITFQGTTAGAPNNLHPFNGCVENDSSEMVFRYTVPAGVDAVRISTEGSSFDTVVYVREYCSQATGGVDLVCNNDRHQGAGDSAQAQVFITQSPPLIEGRVLFIVVDGNNGADGSFTLTVQETPRGGLNQPCRTEEAPPPRCDAPLRCSEGASADGTALCVATVPNNATCDPRGFQNTCLSGARCVADPSPPPDMPDRPVCAQPGTHAGAACRDAGVACDPPLVCGTGEFPICVRVLRTGQQCDESGFANACPTGQTCSPLGEGGPPICH